MDKSTVITRENDKSIRTIGRICDATCLKEKLSRVRKSSAFCIKKAKRCLKPPDSNCPTTSNGLAERNTAHLPKGVERLPEGSITLGNGISPMGQSGKSLTSTTADSIAHYSIIVNN